MSSQLLTGDLLVIICPMNFCLFSISCQLYESNVPSVTYRKIFTLSFILPCLKILPSCCSMSEGRQGTSRWCKAISRSCTFVPAPIFAVEPNKKRTCPLLTFANSSAFLVSVLALWIKAISCSGTPFAMSLSLMSSYTLNVPSPFGVDKSQKISCADFCSFVCSQISNALSTQVVALEFSSSGSISLMSRWSNASFLPSLVIFSILSMFGCTFLSLTASALSARD